MPPIHWKRPLNKARAVSDANNRGVRPPTCVIEMPDRSVPDGGPPR